MRAIRTKIILCSGLLMLLSLLSCKEQESPVTVCPDSPHYFFFKGKPVLLITSDHTYFAITAPGFDYKRYLDKLAEYGANFTRIYPGAHPVNYRDQPRMFPWVETPEGLYDLDKWNETYFKRLHSFMEYAQSKDIIVDIVLFNSFGSEADRTYQERWNWAAFKDSMNIQEGVGTKREYFCTLEEPSLVKYEKDYVRKIVSELNRYNNLIYDIADEPDFFQMINDSLVNLWVSEMIDVVMNTERDLPNKHMISETFHPTLEDGGKHWGADPRTSWISVEYLNGLEQFQTQYIYNKPFTLIETITPVVTPVSFWREGYGPTASRIHSWAFMIAGGAGFMEFNEEYNTQFPAGAQNTDTILSQQKILRDFLNTFEYTKMTHFTGFSGIDSVAVREDTIGHTWGTAMAEPGKQYALYINHSYAKEHRGQGWYQPVPGKFAESVTLSDIPAAKYLIRWINPADGRVTGSSEISHTGGDMILQTPEFTVDIALEIVVTG